MTLTEAELRSSYFDDLRNEELEVLRKTPALFDLYSSFVEMGIQKYGEEATNQLISGFLFAHRVLRYANGVYGLPFISPESISDQLLRYQGDDTLAEEETLQVAEFQDSYGHAQYLIEAVNGFNFVTTRFGARTLFNLFGRNIAKTDLEMDAAIRKKVQKTVDLVYEEVASSEFEVFESEEITTMWNHNPELAKTLAAILMQSETAYDYTQLRKINVGLLLGHRLLRYMNLLHPLPEKTVNDAQEVLATNIRESDDQGVETPLSRNFREVFAKNPDVLALVYDRLSQVRTRNGLTLLLMLYKDDLDPETLMLQPAA